MKDDTNNTNIGDIITPVSENITYPPQLKMASALETDGVVNTGAMFKPNSGDGV
jgi:hypothetical protein